MGLSREDILGPYKVSLGERGKTKITVSEMVEIDPANITQELTQHSGRFAYVASLQAEAVSHMKDIQDQMDAAAFKIDQKIRADIEKRGDKKPAESTIDTMVKNDESYLKIKQTYREAEEAERRLSAIRDAMNHRRVMLDALARMAIQEMGMERPFAKRKE